MTFRLGKDRIKMFIFGYMVLKSQQLKAFYISYIKNYHISGLDI